MCPLHPGRVIFPGLRRQKTPGRSICPSWSMGRTECGGHGPGPRHGPAIEADGASTIRYSARAATRLGSCWWSIVQAAGPVSARVVSLRDAMTARTVDQADHRREPTNAIDAGKDGRKHVGLQPCCRGAAVGDGVVADHEHVFRRDTDRLASRSEQCSCGLHLRARRRGRMRPRAHAARAARRWDEGRAGRCSRPPWAPDARVAPRGSGACPRTVATSLGPSRARRAWRPRRVRRPRHA